MKTTIVCIGLLSAAIAAPALAGPPSPPDLGGTYRVRGECYDRTTEGAYVPCVAWNALTLTRDGVAGRYRFALETNMFATTQGGCSLEGAMTLERGQSGWSLVAERDETNACPIRFEIGRRALTLTLPENERDAESCRRYCSSNASLATDPFPVRSRKK
ncbi:MAG: hypothetical protein E6Q50_13105 [Lysobacter sp.]|nr:MAG: hypothetical protein E6Q50_13105 [Lysobacter sp.]